MNVASHVIWASFLLCTHWRPSRAKVTDGGGNAIIARSHTRRSSVNLSAVCKSSVKSVGKRKYGLRSVRSFHGTRWCTRRARSKLCTERQSRMKKAAASAMSAGFICARWKLGRCWISLAELRRTASFRRRRLEPSGFGIPVLSAKKCLCWCIIFELLAMLLLCKNWLLEFFRLPTDNVLFDF